MNLNLPPNEKVIISDNIKCIEIATELNILSALVPINKESNTAYYFIQEEDTHWGLISYHRGHQDSCDNGYMVLFVPKAKLTKEQAIDFFLTIMQDTSEKITFASVIINQPSSN